MLKNFIIFVLLFQFAIVSWSQMDMFNKTYDLSFGGSADGWTDLVIQNDTMYISGSTSGLGTGYRRFSSFDVNTPQNIVHHQYMTNTQNTHYPGIGKSLMVGTDRVIMSGPVTGDTILSSRSHVLITNKPGDSLDLIFFPDSTSIQSSLLLDSEEYIVSAGSKGVNGNADFWIVKYDTLGNIQWENTFGGSSDEVVFSIDQTHDGGYVIGGFTRSFGAGMRDVYVIKTDSLGNFEWQHVFGDVDNDVGFLKALGNGDILVYGTSRIPNANVVGYARKLDSLGDLKWHKQYGVNINSHKEFQAMTPTSTGYIFAGFTVDETDSNPLGWLLKTDFDGNELWSRRFRKRDSDNYFRDVLELPNGDIMLCGFVFSEDTLSQDAWLVRTNCLGFDTLPKANAEVEVLADQEIRLENNSKAWGNCIIDWGDGTSNYLYEDYSNYIEHTYPNTDERTIKITALACGEQDTMNISVIPSTTQVTKETLDAFTLYPNPSYGKVTLQIPAFQESDYEVRFYNNVGQQVHIEPSPTGMGYEINTSSLSSGVYQVVLMHKNGAKSNKKLVIQH